MKKVFIMMAVVAIAAPVLAFHPTDKCFNCHVPHNAVELSGMPLWAGSEHKFVADVDPYVSYSMQNSGSATTNASLSGSTIVCLSCHDNSTGTGHYPVINAVKDVMGNTVTQAAGNLKESHPIEMVYDNQLTLDDPEMNDPTGPTGLELTKGSIDADLLEGPVGAGKVTCISCHEVHITGLHSLSTARPAGSYDEPQFDRSGNMLDIEGNITADTDLQEIREITVEDGEEFDTRIAHLVNIPGIAMKAGWGTNKADPGAYELAYGSLCRVCHNK